MAVQTGRRRAGPEPAAEDGPGAQARESRTDAELVRAVQQGDSVAFERLVRRHLRVVHAAAQAIVGDADDAEDVSQDAFIAALERIAQCREPERFRAWLLAIVRNRAHDRHRRQRGVHDPMVLDRTPSREPSPERAAARAELRERLREALETLTTLQREVLVLHDYEGWKHREIANSMGISEISSRFNLHVARKAMRARLSGTYGKESLP